MELSTCEKNNLIKSVRQLVVVAVEAFNSTMNDLNKWMPRPELAKLLLPCFFVLFLCITKNYQHILELLKISAGLSLLSTFGVIFIIPQMHLTIVNYLSFRLRFSQSPSSYAAFCFHGGRKYCVSLAPLKETGSCFMEEFCDSILERNPKITLDELQSTLLSEVLLELETRSILENSV